MNGCGGNRLNVMCPKGYYCPNPYTRNACPNGYYCPSGTVEPLSCPIMSICDEGSSYPYSYGVYVFAFIFLLFALIGYKVYIEIEENRLANPNSTTHPGL